MATTTDKKPFLKEITDKLISENVEIFKDDADRRMFTGIFKILFITFAHEKTFKEDHPTKEDSMSLAKHHPIVKKFDDKAEKAGRPSLIEIADAEATAMELAATLYAELKHGQGQGGAGR